jgi:hypothetical protein
MAKKYRHLPALCYYYDPVSEKILLIENGLTGYTVANRDYVKKLLRRNRLDNEEQLADLLNAQMGITGDQRDALVGLSMRKRNATDTVSL